VTFCYGDQHHAGHEERAGSFGSDEVPHDVAPAWRVVRDLPINARYAADLILTLSDVSQWLHSHNASANEAVV